MLDKLYLQEMSLILLSWQKHFGFTFLFLSLLG